MSTTTSKGAAVTLCFSRCSSYLVSRSPRAGPLLRSADPETDPPFTPALWLLLWVTLAAGFVEAYAVMGSYTFQALPATAEFFFPKPGSNVGSGLWAAANNDATAGGPATNHQQQQQQRSPLQGLANPRLMPTYVTISTALHSNGSPAAATGQQAAHELYCTWTRPGALSLIPQLSPILAAVAAAVICSRYGRRTCTWAGTLLAVAGQVLLAASQWHWMFMAGFGCAYGASAMLHTALVLEDAEIAPPRFRGSFMAANVFGQAVGWLTAAMLAVVFVDKGQWGWRTLYALGVLPGVLLLLVLPWLPETPHSLLLRGKVEEGRAALRTIRGPFYSVGRELADIVAAAGPNPGLASQLCAFFSRKQRAPLLMTLILLLAQELHGRQYMERFVNSLSALLTAQQPPTMGLARFIILAAAQMMGAVLAAGLVDRIGRRAMLAGCSLLAALCFGGMAGLLGGWLPQVQAGLGPAVAALAAMSSITEMCAAAGWVATYSALTAELHCLRTRAVAVAFTVASMWVLTYLRFWARAAMLCAMQWGALAFFAAANVANALVVVLLLPETKQLPLERIRGVWGQHWLWRHLSPPSFPAQYAAGGGAAALSTGAPNSSLHSHQTCHSSGCHPGGSSDGSTLAAFGSPVSSPTSSAAAAGAAVVPSATWAQPASGSSAGGGLGSFIPGEGIVCCPEHGPAGALAVKQRSGAEAGGGMARRQRSGLALLWARLRRGVAGDGRRHGSGGLVAVLGGGRAAGLQGSGPSAVAIAMADESLHSGR